MGKYSEFIVLLVILHATNHNNKKTNAYRLTKSQSTFAFNHFQMYTHWIFVKNKDYNGKTPNLYCSFSL